MTNVANTNDPLGLEVGVIECRNAPGQWHVEAIDHGSEGEIYVAVFSGPRAREMALEYAAWKYGHDGQVLDQPTFLGTPYRPRLTVIEGGDGGTQV